MQTRIHLQPRKVGLILGSFAVALALQSIFNEFLLETYVGSQSTSLLATVLDLFSVNLEESIPTWYSTMNLLIASGLFTLIALNVHHHGERDRRYWVGLAILFAYLSMDEGAAIHEILADPLQTYFQTTGFLAFGWQIVAVPLVAILGVIYLRFLWRLPAHIRKLFILSAGLYAGGALLIEGLSANQWFIDQSISLSYLAIATVEELCEMLGVVTLIYALLTYMADRNLLFRIDTQASANSEPLDHNTKPKRILNANTTQKKILMGIVFGWVVTNFLFVYLSVNAVPSATTIEVEDVAFYQAMIDEYSDRDLVVTHVPGIYGVPGSSPDKIVASIAGLYDDVMVVSLPEIDSSVIFADDALPFDRTEMSSILSQKGQTQFIIYENDLIRQLLNR